MNKIDKNPNEINRIYEQITKQYSEFQGKQLQTKVMNWFFNLNINDKQTVACVKNSLTTKEIYLMYMRFLDNPSICFKLKGANEIDCFQIFPSTTQTKKLKKLFSTIEQITKLRKRALKFKKTSTCT